MSKIKIITPGLLTTIQDMGRYAYQQFGISVSGVMDTFAHRTANILVDNPDSEAVLEVTLMGPAIEFLDDSTIAITGGNLSPSIDGVSIPMWQSVFVKKGVMLSFGGLKTGARAYISFAGGIDVPVVMGSKSTYVKAGVGGLEGRPLKSGDILQLNALGHNVSNRPCKAVPLKYRPVYLKQMDVRVVLGPQEDYFTETGLAAFLNNAYTISNECDRMGCRLEGEVIQHKDSGDIISDGITMGTVQVPGNGQPIILMADRQTIGGYTKIATVISVDLPKISQAKAGDVIFFKEVSVIEAQDILKYQEKVFEDIRQNCMIPFAPAIPAARSKIVVGVRNYKITVNNQPFDVKVELLGK